MTAGTKAILLLSVVGLIVLVAWYGDGPPQGLSEQTRSHGPLHANDPLLAAASENRVARQPVRSTPPPAPAREIPSPPVRRDRAKAAGNRLAVGPTENESRVSSSPPTLEMGQAIDTSVQDSWQPAKWDAMEAQIRAGTRVQSRPTDSSASSTASARVPEPPTPPAESRSQSSRPVAQQTYTVKPGDTLGHIAQRYYGAASHWNLIADANPGIDPGSLRVRDELVIPAARARAASGSTRRTENLPPLAKGRTHTIGEGETLSSIAEDQLGHEKHWYRIYEFNEKRIGNNPDRLVLGMVIAIPGYVNLTSRQRFPSFGPDSSYRSPRM